MAHFAQHMEWDDMVLCTCKPCRLATKDYRRAATAEEELPQPWEGYSLIAYWHQMLDCPCTSCRLATKDCRRSETALQNPDERLEVADPTYHEYIDLTGAVPRTTIEIEHSEDPETIELEDSPEPETIDLTDL